MTASPTSTSTPTSLRFLLGKRLATVSGIFLIIVSGILLLNAYLLHQVDPLDSPALEILITQLDQDPDNETLLQQVRELDLLARRAFFVRQWQLETGGILLAIAGIVFVISLYLMTADNRRLPDWKRCPGLNAPWPMAVRARWIITAGSALLILAIWGLYLVTVQHASVRQPSLTAAALDDAVDPAPPAVEEPDESVGWPAAFKENWPTFRGLGGLGSAHGADPPTTWDGNAGEGILWKAEVPRRGFSSPVVWKNRVFLTGADANIREIYCYDADTGELLWTADAEDVPGTPDEPPAVADDTGYAAPSVAVDGDRVVAIFATGVIVAHDFDGRRLWARHLGTPDNHYGHSSSLLIFNDMVFVQFDHFGGSQLKALELETGRTRWNRPRTSDISWASPILIEVEDRMLLILAAAPMVAAYDALTGEERWSNNVLSGEVGSSPTYANGRVFAANIYAQAVSLDASTGETHWETSQLELPDAASPVATDRFLFLPTSFGVFSCVDVTDGSVVWEQDFDTGGYGSPVLVEDRIYWVTSDGVTRIFKASENFELIAESPLGEPSVSTPAFVDTRIYIRGEKHLFCIGGP